MKFLKEHKFTFLTLTLIIVISCIPFIIHSVNPKESNPLPEETTVKYVNKEGVFEYTYPVTWTFADGREGIGLVPIYEKNKNNNYGEIVTIATVKTDLSLIDWSKQYDGSGYQVEKEMTINGYSAYYIFKQFPELTMEIYTFKHKNNIVRIDFRKKDSSSYTSYDFSQYEDDFISIVNSIKFL